MPATIPHFDVKQAPYYLNFSKLLKAWYPHKTYKVTIDAGMTCPNIDGTVTTGGCTYCDNTSFSPAFREKDPLIRRQIDSGVSFYKEKYGADKFLAYFQTFSNTFAPVEKLKKLYDRSLKHENIVGLSIGTRPDCIDEEKLALLQSCVDEDPSRLICIEYGMQTMHDETAIAINRGHDHQCTIDAMELTRKVAPGLHICLHIIAGLPGETHEMIRQSAEECARLKPDSVKLHHCYVYRNTKLADQWRDGDYRAMEYDEYVSLAADVIERLPSTTYIQRMVGEINADGVLAPHWGKSKLQIMSAISDELKKRGSWQGFRCNLPA